MITGDLAGSPFLWALDSRSVPGGDETLSLPVASGQANRLRLV